jgi:predicted DNA-binding WGR domain protein
MNQVRLFTRIRPEENEQRWYAIAWGPTLFGAWGVQLSWGRLGTNRYQQQVQDFPTERQAMTEAQAQVERRLKRGYVEAPIDPLDRL